jgi:hypothetical protein
MGIMNPQMATIQGQGQVAGTFGAMNFPQGNMGMRMGGLGPNGAGPMGNGRMGVGNMGPNMNVNMNRRRRH